MTPFIILMAMAAIVLLIASLNLANMMLARGTARRKEVAMRLALGGTRGQIVRQFLTEGAVLAVVGGAAGLMLGYWGISLLVSSLMPLSPVPLAFDARPDVRVLAATIAFCGLSTILFGLGPAWRLARTDVGRPPQGAGRGGQPNRPVHGVRRAQPAGRRADRLVAGPSDRGRPVHARRRQGGRRGSGLPARPPGARCRRYRTRRVRRSPKPRPLPPPHGAAALGPGVQSASLASVVAFGEISEEKTVQKGGTPPGTGKDGRPVGKSAVYYVVGSDYFATLGVPVLRGRGFTLAEEQDPNAPAVAVIDEPLARALFPDRDPIGQQVQIAPRDEAAPAGGSGIVVADGPSKGPQVMEVVGVVAGLAPRPLRQVARRSPLRAVRPAVPQLDEHPPPPGLR